MERMDFVRSFHSPPSIHAFHPSSLSPNARHTANLKQYVIAHYNLTLSRKGGKVMRTRIPKEPLEVIVHRLVEGLQPEQIILFGSYAYGQPSEGSDLDIMIIVPESSEPAHRREQKAYACVGAIGVPKDLLVLTREEFEKQARVVTSLARRVKEKGEVLYERGETHGNSEVADKSPA